MIRNARYFINKYNLKGLEGNEELFEEFIEYLQVFSRYSCPEHFYRAWKILILETSEYDQKVNRILNEALNLYLDLEKSDEGIQLHHLQFKLEHQGLSREEVKKLIVLEVKREHRRSQELYDTLLNEEISKLKEKFTKGFVLSYIMLLQALLDAEVSGIDPNSNLYKRLLFNANSVEKQLEFLRVEMIGRRGEIVKFNKNLHVSNQEIPEGTEVEIIIPGFPGLGKAFVKKK